MGCTKTADTGVTQELLSLVTGMAQNLKSLIRIGLAQALRLVRKRVITGTTDQHAHHLYTHTRQQIAHFLRASSPFLLLLGN